MARLIARDPVAEVLPVTIGGVTLAHLPRARFWLLRPFAGQSAAVAAAIMAQTGLIMPQTACRVSGPAGFCQWFAQETWAITAPVALPGLAGVTDQADGWVALVLTGAELEAVLARLVPLDLGPRAFGLLATRRSLAGQIPVCLTRLEETTVEIMVMRSYAAGLVEDLCQAMQRVAGQDAV